MLTKFIPSRDGFHFANQFANRVIQSPLGTWTTHGRCGGMAYAALDYYFSDIPMPTHISGASPFASGIDDFSGSGEVLLPAV